MNAEKIVEFLRRKLENQKIYFPNGTEYTENEMRCAFYVLHSRQLGEWRQYPPIAPEEAVDRVDWLLNGSYGAGELFTAWTWIINTLDEKKGKNVDRAWLSIGRELTIYVAFLESSECTPRKIMELWKKQGADFNSINSAAASEVKRILANEMEDY